uniref:Uncharacterized protein n=1 Tax=Klebsiella pneumoniae TaxID=573 RepID=A0A8B0SSM2_KLEPN|nr:hypothetical protein [Klebsiella pneumoniae]
MPLIFLLEDNAVGFLFLSATLLSDCMITNKNLLTDLF